MVWYRGKRIKMKPGVENDIEGNGPTVSSDSGFYCEAGPIDWLRT